MEFTLALEFTFSSQLEVPSAPLFCKRSIFQRPLAMPLSRLFEALFDSSVVVKYPIF